MLPIALALIGLIAALHFHILWFEMVACESKGPGISQSLLRDLFPKTKAMAANQGLYNGYLAAGLVWSLCITEAGWARDVASFFLICIAVAGAHGTASASHRILYVQTVPAVLALAALGQQTIKKKGAIPKPSLRRSIAPDQINSLQPQSARCIILAKIPPPEAPTLSTCTASHKAVPQYSPCLRTHQFSAHLRCTCGH